MTDSEKVSCPNKAVFIVSEQTGHQRNPQDADHAQEPPGKLWKNIRICCDHCRQPGEVHFRVITARLTDWILVCDTCWPNFREEAGYRYGGTRKANRRKRKRR